MPSLAEALHTVLRHRAALAATGLFAAAFVALWLVTGGGPSNAIRAALAAGGLGAIVWLMPRYPVAAVGVTFMLAALSRITIELPLGTMRLEQPALAALIALTIWHRRSLNLPSLEPISLMLMAGFVYLGALAASSALVADDPAASLRLVAWTALSMIGGLVAALLLAGRAARAMAWFSGATGILAVIGLLSGVGYVLFAIGAPWILGAGTTLPRVSAFVLEPNLYASLLAATIPLALERWRARPAVSALAIALVLMLGVGLGVTRGAYIGLLVGLAIYFGLMAWRARTGTRLVAVAVLVLVVGGIGLAMPKLLLDPSQAGLLVSDPGRPGVPGQPGTGGPKPPITPPDHFDTLEYRMARVSIGIDEWSASPLIGRGAFSYGQRHIGDGGIPEVIAVWPVAALHDGGLIGLGGLLAFLGLLGARLWRQVTDMVRGPTASAFAAAVVVLLVAYLATTALHFAVTWLILGGALAATMRSPREESEAEDAAGHNGFAWRLTAPLTERSRGRRHETFMRLMNPREQDRVLDVGVNDTTWRASNFLEARYPWPSQITAVAPAPVPAFGAAFPEVRLVVADGRALPFSDGEFDIGFSNAVIEHVGSREQQRQFVIEMARTCRRTFICTPNARFPIDPHSLLPFAHWLPRRWWHALLRATGNERWASEQMLNPLSARDLLSLFPPGISVRIERQRLFGLTTVLIAVAERPDGAA